MNKKLRLASAGVMLSTLAISGVAFAGASGNVGMSSDYLWRGMTQTNHQSAVSGGLDYGHDVGVYMGTWASNVSWTGTDAEIDLYGGYSKEFGPVGIDVGAIYYMYPHVDFDSNSFYEVYGSFSAMGASVSVYYNIDASDTYVSGGYDHEVAKGVTISLAGGWSKESGNAHYGLSLTKGTDAGDFSVLVSDTTDTATGSLDKNPTMVVSYTKGFDL